MLEAAGKTFGIGLSRTGTKSLAAALNVLGVRTKWYPQDPQTYQELISGRFRLTILEHYDAVTDIPVAPYYPQLDAAYPGSKFVLTVRDKESWLRSCRNKWGSRRVPLADAPFPDRFACFIDTTVYGCYAFHADRFSWVYDRHVEHVQRYFRDRPEDLLVMDITAGDGWDLLCPFLNLPIPDQSFPKVNAFDSPLLG